MTLHVPPELLDLESGKTLELSYPINTHVRNFDVVPRRLRRFQIRYWRDMVQQPLTINDFLRRPFTIRSRWLANVWDTQLREFRQIYLGTSNEFLSSSRLRLALYHPDKKNLIEVLGREFEPTVVDRRNLIRLIRDIQVDDHDGLDLRVMADDFRVVG